jgi:SanA protein
MKKVITLIISILLVVTLISVFVCNLIVIGTAKSKLYSSINEIPFRKIGLLLGTSPKMANGNTNPFYKNRILAAAALIRAGKIKYLIISGDNGTREYNEPESMRSDLMKMGIDSTIIYLDYAGFRTFDSIKRLKEIFGQDSVTVISQKFHNERAIYIATNEGIDAIGFNAQDISAKEGLRTELRERLARVKIFIDKIIGTKPKYLGHRVQIGDKYLPGTGMLIPINFSDTNYTDLQSWVKDTISSSGWSINYLVKDDSTRYNDLYIRWNKGNRTGLFCDSDVLLMRRYFIPVLAGENGTHIFWNMVALLPEQLFSSCQKILFLKRAIIFLFGTIVSNTAK